MTTIEKLRLVQLVFVILLFTISLVIWFYSGDPSHSLLKSIESRSLSDWLGIMQVAIGVLGIILIFIGWNKIQAVLPMAVYSGLQKYRIEGQAGPLQSDLLGNLQVTSATYMFGEDSNRNVMRTQFQGRYHVPITDSAEVCNGVGQLYGIVINSAEPGATLKILDGQNNSAGTIVFDTITFKSGVDEGPKVISLPAVIEFYSGCYFVLTGKISVTPILH